MDIYGLAGPLLRCLDAETAHGIAIGALKYGLVPARPPVVHPSLKTSLWGLDFPNPLGLAAGFDKNADVPETLLKQGFGFVEVGSVTPQPQPGNPRPRLFRLPDHEGIINRMGFNNRGMEFAAGNLRSCARQQEGREQKGIIGVNLGKNKDSVHAVDDYVTGIRNLAACAAYIVVNVSSPNTPGLRTLQDRGPLESLLSAARKALDETVPVNTPPLLLKIAPDLNDDDKSDIARVIGSAGVDGLIATNTTISRPPGLTGASATASETGGLSGKPLASLSTGVIADMYQLLGPHIPIIGCGGIHSASSAYEKIRAGASLVQLYSALVYQGPGLIRTILTGLIDLLATDGCASVAEAVGADHR